MVTEGSDMHGKVALVTGATSGIGKEIARGLLRLGAEVIIGARDVGRGGQAAKEIADDVKSRTISVLEVDMAHLASVRRFATEVAARAPKLHVVVNNAGVWATDRRESPEGHEVTFATNVLGPYLLTNLLLDRLRASGSARVVNVVSSFAAYYDVTDLEFKTRKWDGFKAYGQSKQALRMVTNGLAARIQGSGVTANNAAPGFVRTAFNRDARGFIATMINLSARFMADTPAKGAETPLWVATAKELEGANGKYFEKHKEGESKFTDPGPIATLEKALGTMTSA